MNSCASRKGFLRPAVAPCGAVQSSKVQGSTSQDQRLLQTFYRPSARFKACPEFVERVQKFKVQCFLKELASPGRLHVLRILKTSKRPPFDIPALDSSKSPQAVDIETNLAQIIFAALRQLIREEIDAVLKRPGRPRRQRRLCVGNEVRRGHDVAWEIRNGRPIRPDTRVIAAVNLRSTSPSPQSAKSARGVVQFNLR